VLLAGYDIVSSESIDVNVEPDDLEKHLGDC
jgi:hypothetical protein